MGGGSVRSDYHSIFGADVAGLIKELRNNLGRMGLVLRPNPASEYSAQSIHETAKRSVYRRSPFEVHVADDFLGVLDSSQ